MFKSIVKKVVGDPMERAIAKYRVAVEQINALEPEMKKLPKDGLRAKTEEFKQRIVEGETLDDLLVEAYALVREAAVRTIGLRPYDVQMIGGIVLHQGRIAEMKTGEGKTLVATLPLYLNALLGKGAHLVTPNDYLSKVGLQMMGPVYHLLGLQAAVIQNTGTGRDSGSFLFDPEYPSDDARYQFLRPVSRFEAYDADITYGTNSEFGFDYLRDNIAMEGSRLSQRERYFAIVDEVDNILIDEARTPLIISGQAEEASDLYGTFARIVRTLKPSSAESIDNEDPDGDYVLDIKDRVSYLTETGVEKAERALNIDQLYHADHADMIPYLDNALRALTLYHRDKEYIVADDGQVIIVDEFTGRLMYGRRFSEGLHQSIEAKEGVKVRRENMTLATITLQNFFRMYKKLAGMTGTAMTEAEEFEKIYNLEVVPIPTNLPNVREDLEDLIYMNEGAKFKAVIDEIKQRHEAGQPVLVGTVAVETSERLSKALERAHIQHQVLNAKQHEREAEIIAQAGRPGAVTIATNMAGRGVDILLGGNGEGLTRERLRKQGIEITNATPEEKQAAHDAIMAEVREDRKRVLEQGGLFVLGTERHEARRIDNQLRGRSARQGDPGQTRFFLSLEDDLMKRFGGDRVKGFMTRFNLPEDEPIEHGMISKSIEQAQIRVEGHHFDMRKRVLEYDDVVNKQREMIYTQRQQTMTKDSLREEYLQILETMVETMIDDFTTDEDDPDSWDTDALYQQLFTVFPIPEDITPDTLIEMSLTELEDSLGEAVRRAYDRKSQELGEEMMKRAERIVMMRSLDTHWQRHLTDLDVLREGIGLMSIAQRDPLVEYKREAFVMFNAMQEEIRTNAARSIFRVQVNMPQPVRQQIRAFQPVVAGAAASAGGTTTNAVQNAKPEPVRNSARENIGRNDPCWCGSGKKYKHCHMRQDQTERRT
ncbi:MAG: preprotein translocase subunit SecA [Burkholderiales bacterium]|nr:preprotein translocase subunit SecA [Anaerolineae bacterium]